MVNENNIDQSIEEWHKSDSEITLHEYLGLSFEEYSYWVETGILPKTNKLLKFRKGK